MSTATQPRPATSILTLIAIIVSARKSGDRELERQAIDELREAHGIRLSFARPPVKREASHA